MKSTSDGVRVGIVGGGALFGESLRNALKATPDTRCVGVWRDANECIGQVRKARPSIVLMGLDLPGTACIEATTILKRLMPDIRVIIIATDPDTERIAELVRAGACGYLIKPTPACLLSSLTIATPVHGEHTIAAKAREVRQGIHDCPGESKLDKGDNPLSRSEMLVARLISEGLRNKEIADRLRIGNETARSHTRNLFRKLNVHSRTEIAVKYLKSLPEWKKG